MRAVAVAAGLLPLWLGSAADAECLKASVDNQSAEGRLTSVIITVPDYKLKEQAYLLQLAKPACLEGDYDFDKVEKTDRIHVFAADDTLRKKLRSLVGKAVRVRGQPFGEHTVHHHAPIVMGIDAIEALPAKL